MQSYRCISWRGSDVIPGKKCLKSKTAFFELFSVIKYWQGRGMKKLLQMAEGFWCC